VQWTLLDDAVAATAAGIPALATIAAAAPNASFRIHGLKIAREPRRYSGRTSMRANISVHEPRASQDPDSALAFSMEGFAGPNEASPLVPFAAAPGWNSPSAWNKFQDEVGGSLKGGDQGVRLFTQSSPADYFAAVPAAFVARSNELRVVPIHHLFGSDEMAAKAPVTESRNATAYVALSAATAAQLTVGADAVVMVRAGAGSAKLPVRIDDSLPTGSVGLPVGLGDQPLVARQGWATITLQGGL